ncbi:TPA: hypothetical protein ACTW2L_001090 [Raoultella planticola]
MTDITELAQSLKAAAEKAIAEEGSTWWNEEQLASDYGLALHRTDAKFIALASHENVLALVEALEKAQTKNELVAGGIAVAEKLHERIAYLEKRLKGTEESLIASTDMVAELESRTVKLPEAFYPDGDIDCPLVVNLDDVKEMLTTTGINWEAE